MPDVYVNKEGLASFINPDTGEYHWVEKGEVKRAIALGMTPETPQMWVTARMQEKYGDRTAAALGAGIARGATLGLSDLVLPSIFGETDFSKLRQFNPGVSTAGDILGTVASAVTPGGAVKLAGKAAAGFGGRAATQIGAWTGREAASLIPRLAGTATRSAAEGFAIGAGHGLSNVALSQGPVGLLEGAGEIAEQAGYGALLSGGLTVGLGVAGAATRATGGFLKRRLVPNVKGLKDTRAAMLAIDDEIGALQKAGDSGAMPSAQVAKRMEILQGDKMAAQEIYKIKRREMGFMVGSRAAGAMAGSLVGGLPGAVVGGLITPPVMKVWRHFMGELGMPLGALTGGVVGGIPGAVVGGAVGAQLSRGGLRQIGKNLLSDAKKLSGDTGLTKAISSAVPKARQPAGFVPPGVTPSAAGEGFTEAAKARLGKLYDKMTKDERSLFEQAMKTKLKVPEGYKTGAGIEVEAGNLAGAAAIAGGVATGSPALFSAGVMANDTVRSAMMDVVGPVLRTSNRMMRAGTIKAKIDIRDDQSLTDFAADIHTLGSDDLEIFPDVARHDGVSDDAQLFDGMKARAAQTFAFLQEKSPVPAELPAAGTTPEVTRPAKPNPSLLRKFGRYVDGVQDPSGIIEKLVQGRATAEHMETLQRVYPEVLEFLQSAARSAKIRSEAEGRRLNYKQKAVLEMLLTGQRQRPHLHQLQSFHRSREQAKLKSANVNMDRSNKAMSRAQKTLERL